MKLSVKWIFDHLKADLKNYSIEKIISFLNAQTCEVEAFEKISFDFKPFALGKVLDFSNDSVTLECPEWNKIITVPHRDNVHKGACYLIKKIDNKFEWAHLHDWFSTKDGLLPAFYCNQKDLKGEWKKQLPTSDYILEVDNKSITNRPDLWGHRGFARELSVLLGVALKDEKSFLAKISIKAAEKKYKATDSMPFTIINDAPKVCKRFSAYCIESIEYRPSVLWMAARLASVDARPIDLIVDATNYAMLDVSQPIHAFDAQLFKDKIIEPRFAKKGEKLTLLDGTELTLTCDDLIITDGEKPVALAGIMGGRESGISKNTTSLLIESANFDATTIRLASARNKVRTDASARFEKTLDPNQNVKGIERFVQLLRDEAVSMKECKQLVSLGEPKKSLKITLKHAFIEGRLGVELEKRFVKNAFESLGFTVSVKADTYNVSVPSQRSSKDITIKEDLVEEIARLYGYDKLPEKLPLFETIPSYQPEIAKIRNIKQYLAFGAHMREVENYALFDDEFLKMLNWSIKDAASLKNSLSETRTTLVTSLVPHLLQNIAENSADNDTLRFFELARVWNQSGKKITEHKSLAGVFYNKRVVDFYQAKALVNDLFVMLDIPIEWKKATSTAQWASKFQTADLYCGKIKMGTAGMVAQRLIARLALGHVFAFELDIDALLAFTAQEKKFKALPKYQATSFDMSMMVPTEITVGQLLDAIKKADDKIFDATLIDEFKKPEWENKKSITMRFWMRDPEKTLSKEVLESGYAAAQKAVKKYGAEIR